MQPSRALMDPHATDALVIGYEDLRPERWPPMGLRPSTLQASLSWRKRGSGCGVQPEKY